MSISEKLFITEPQVKVQNRFEEYRNMMTMLYRDAKNKKTQIKIFADLCGATREEVALYLLSIGYNDEDIKLDSQFEKLDYKIFRTEGYKAIADMMNGVSDKTGVRVEVNNTQIFGVVAAGTIKDFMINGVKIGNVTVKTNDSDNALIAAINAKKDETGVEASLENGRLVLAAKDGRAIRLGSTSTGANTVFSAKTGASLAGNAHSAGTVYLGQITFIRQDARDIKVGLGGISLVSGFTAGDAMITAANASTGYAQASVNLKYMN